MAELNMALLLKESLNNMRGELGKGCTYLAFEKEGDFIFYDNNLCLPDGQYQINEFEKIIVKENRLQ